MLDLKLLMSCRECHTIAAAPCTWVMKRSPLWNTDELTQLLLCKATLMVLTVTTDRMNLVSNRAWTALLRDGSWQVDYHMPTRPPEEFCILTCSSETALSSASPPHIDTALLLLRLHCALRGDIRQTSRRLHSVLHILVVLNVAEVQLALT